MFTREIVNAIAPKGKSEVVEDLPELLNKYLPEYDINTPERVSMFLANILTETGGFRALEENLNYSAKRLMQVWPSRFKTMAMAKQYERDPEKLANLVYDRYGNKGNKGYGWKYRGRGFMMQTFIDNYAMVENQTGMPVIDDPDMLGVPETALIAACIFWKVKGLNAYADADRITDSRKVINGGTHGLDQVKAHYRRILPIMRAMALPGPGVTGGDSAIVGTGIAAGGTSVVALGPNYGAWAIGIAVVIILVAAAWVGLRISKRSASDVLELAIDAIRGDEDISLERDLNRWDGPDLHPAADPELPDGDGPEADPSG